MLLWFNLKYTLNLAGYVILQKMNDSLQIVTSNGVVPVPTKKTLRGGVESVFITLC